ncbi:hypothetical protein CDD81_1513 [Ophiocordyceps australis]|uniref:Serine hydrolase domain-containing protein n=1 Tax=Ophiocordyceps australis TaxID=1399860 RepID=A0A2C5YDK6_9HYPO|nr:hypothetical protein CDD81_1513 [Ophiocordyceps australis]
MSCPAPKPATPSTAPTAKEIKILMLHGYTQSGSLFQAKTRGLEKLLCKTLSPLSLHLLYPTAPNRLLPSDLHSYTPPDDPAAASPEFLPDSWAWWRKDNATGSYRLLPAGMDTIAQAIRAAGGIDAVVGFSQGACLALAVAAALEPQRPIPPGQDADWARSLREANNGAPLSFAVAYSGFAASPKNLAWLYDPLIQTPTLHYIGSLDVVVDEDRTRAVIERCRDPVVVVHPGGHFVPVSREWVMALAGFIKQHVGSEPKAGL